MQNNILLAVDDKAENLYILNELVVENLPDCHLLMAASAEEGLAIAAEKNVDGVILDVQMPRIDGLEMCRRLKANAKTAHIPVVLITAHKSSPELRARCLEAGADDFISKPIGSVELLAKIRVLLRIKKAEDNLRALNAHLEEMVEERTRALRESERKYRFLSENVLDVIWTIDNDFRFTYVSPSIRHLRGFEAEEAMKETIEESMTPESYRLVQETYARLLDAEAQRRTNEAACVEIQQKRKDGSMVWVEARIKPILNDEGHRIGFIGVSRDISALKQYEEERETTLKVLQLINSSNDTHELIQEITGFMKNWSGCEAVGIRLREGEDFPYYETRGFPEEFVLAENRLCLRDENNEPIRDSEGNPILECICGNILCGRFNPALPFFTPFGSFWSNCTTDLLASLTEAERQTRTRNRCNSEGYESVALVPLRFGDKTLGLMQFNDKRKGRFTPDLISFLERTGNSIAAVLEQKITQAKLIESNEALRKSEEWRRTILRKAMDGFWVVDLQGRLLEVNETYCRMSGYSAQELLVMRINDLEIIETSDDTASRIQKIMAQSEERFESQHRRKDGSIFDVEISAQFQPAEGERFVVFLQDITERKRAEEALQEQIRLNKIFMDSMPCAALLIHPITREIVAANRMGIEFGAAPGTKCFDTWIKRDDPCPWCLAIEKRTCGPPQQREVEHHGAIWDVHWIPVSEDLFLHYAFDITEKRQMEKQLLQAQKLEALGTLSGGIAHDFNNILTAIMGYTHLALSSIHNPEVVQEYLSIVMKASERAKNLVGQILAFSRKNDTDKHPFPIASAIKEGLKLLRSTLPTTIEIKQNIESDSMVMGDLNQIHQILMNLCMNAAHAMRDQGNLLVVSLTDREIQENMPLPLSDLPPGKYVCLTVKDDGHGIDPLIRDRVFDPFFTTKDKSEGTGLGLSVVLGIVKNHNGVIQLDSAPGQGTIFSVYLPIIGNTQNEQEDNPSLQMGNGEWILFSDDEEFLRDLGRKMLESLGYHPVVCANGKEALEAFLLDPMKYDLVMTDQTMPRMTGMQLAQEILHRRPEIPVLLYTGYDERVTPESAASIGIRQVLMKPLDIVHLSKIVDKLLSKNG